MRPSEIYSSLFCDFYIINEVFEVFHIIFNYDINIKYCND